MSAPTTFVPPLDIARTMARHSLAKVTAIDVSTARDGELIIGLAHAETALQMLLAALDKEDGQ